jgi:hypothetical protein
LSEEKEDSSHEHAKRSTDRQQTNEADQQKHENLSIHFSKIFSLKSNRSKVTPAQKHKESKEVIISKFRPNIAIKVL